MKVIGYSAWVRPEVITVKSSREAKTVKREMRDRQLKVEILTEKEF
jgi:hypothetical protein